MKITVTGASGFLGRHLVEELKAAAHEVHVLGRNRWNTLSGQEPPPESLEHLDAIVHLAGEPVAQRWTAEVKKRIRTSRVDGTRHLVNALSTLSRRPKVLVSASAIGIYGDRGDEVLSEQSGSGVGFLAQVTEDWESAARLAEALGIRVVMLRFGMVLGQDGGALAKMLPIFRWGLGGKLGTGRQWMSWIHVADVTALMRHALATDALHGPINATAPNPVTNAEFTRTLALALHRPGIFPVPAFALKLAYGEMASVILASQRVLPVAAESADFHFKYPGLAGALAACVSL
jgi:uncharacterized protein (TIGR01777 family)